MLTENEVGQLLDIPEVKQIVHQLHQSFTEEEPELKDISLHDFLSGILLSPSVALAQVDGTTSLFEELSLNKKARRFSKGGFFSQTRSGSAHDHSLAASLSILGTAFFSGAEKHTENGGSGNLRESEHEKDGMVKPFTVIMNSSYILIRFLETFFLP